jgi:hypothetical protein
VAVSVGLWPVAVFASGVFGVNIFTATAAVHGPTSASSPILKAIRAKKYIIGLPLALIVSRARMHIIDATLIRLVIPADAIFSFSFSLCHVFPFFFSFPLSFLLLTNIFFAHVLCCLSGLLIL